jgi:hypothetical protein
MSTREISIIIGGCCAALALAAWIGLIVVPAWRAYGRLWERVAATFLTLYVLAGLAVAGGMGGALIAYYWDEITG